jgi:hypothetical protein
LRIDYALCSKQLLDHVQSCEVVLDMPPKWSDHAPIMLELQLPAAAAAPQSGQQQQQAAVCRMWRDLMKRFADPSQRSIASMFKAAKPSSSNKPAAAAGVSQQMGAKAGVAAGGNAAAAAGTATGKQAAADAQKTSSKRPLGGAAAAAAAAELGSGHTSTAPGAEDDIVNSRGVKSARLDESAELSTALQEEDSQQQTQQQQKEQQQQQQQPVAQQHAVNASAATAAEAARCHGSNPAAGVGRSADRKGSKAETGKQASNKSSGGSKQHQQLAGQKQSSLHAFLARPTP